MSDEQVWAILQTTADSLADRPTVEDEQVASALMFATWVFLTKRLGMPPENAQSTISDCMREYAQNEQAKNEKERPS